MLRRITQEHPTVQEFEPPKKWLIADGPDQYERPVWLEPPRSALEDTVGRIRYFGFGILVVATLAVLPVLLLFLPVGQQDDLDETELAELLAAGQATTNVAPVNASETHASEIAGSLISIDTNPSGAVVLLDYDSVGTTPFRGRRLKPGVYVLSVRKQDYAPLDTVVFVDGREANPIVSVTLRPERHEGDVEARSMRVPVPAQRPDDGPPQAERQHLRSNETGARASEPGARTADAGPKSAPGTGDAPGPKTDPGHAKNTVDDRTQAGKLVVLVKPWGSIYIDGNLYKRDTDIQYTTTLPAGLHRIRVVHPELGAREREVQVQADQPVDIVFDLLGEQ